MRRLAALLFAAVLVFVGPGADAQVFSGAYAILGTTARIGWNGFANGWSGCSLSPYLRLELWAAAQPRTGLVGVNDTLIASQDLGIHGCASVAGGTYDVPIKPTITPGTYYMQVAISESPQSGCTAGDGYCPVTNASYSNFGAFVFTAANFTLIPQAGLWWNPAESGSGYALDVKHNVLLVTVYSYTPSGASQWYLVSGPLSADGKVFTGTLDKYQSGQCISCAYTGRPAQPGNDGAMFIQFSSPTSGTMTLPGGRVIPIEPQPF